MRTAQEMSNLYKVREETGTWRQKAVLEIESHSQEAPWEEGRPLLRVIMADVEYDILGLLMCDADLCRSEVSRLFLCSQRYGGLSLVCVVCCQVEVSVSGWSLFQRSPNECGVECRTECYFETSTIRRTWPIGSCRTFNHISQELDI